MRDPISHMKGLLASNFSPRVLASSGSNVWVLDVGGVDSDIGVDPAALADPAGVEEGPLGFGET